MATWGAISWRGTTPGGTAVKLFTRSGNTTRARRDVERVVVGVQRVRRRADHQPQGALPAVEDRALGQQPSAPPLVTSVTVAYLQRNLRPEVSSITVHPPGVVFQKPFSSGDAELAGFDGVAERPARQPAGAGLRRDGHWKHRSRRSAAARYQKGLQTLIWKADDDNDDELAVRRAVPPRRRDDVEAAQARASPIRSSSGTRRRCRMAPTS